MRYVFLAAPLVLALSCGNDSGTKPDAGAGGKGETPDTGGASGTGGNSGTGGGASKGSGGKNATGGTLGTGGQRATGGGAGASDGGASDGGASDGGTGRRPHPLYPPLDLDTLPGKGGGAIGPYEPPALPGTTRNVTVSGTDRAAHDEILAACATAGTAVTVPDGAGRVGSLDFGNVSDCDVTLGANVIAEQVYVGHLPGPQVAPTHRIRIRGGQIGHIMVDPGSTDIVFDGVTVNNAILPPDQRTGTGIYLIANGATVVNRFGFVNSIIRLLATTADGGCAYLAGNARNVFFANDNVVTGGHHDSWGFRISGGDNFIIVDSTVRISFHKMIRMNDGPVDYVYVKGGTWIREASVGTGGERFNDTWAQIGDLGTDNVYIHDPSVYLLSSDPLYFGASNGPGQAGKSWNVRGVAWHAPSAAVVSDAVLRNLAGNCAAGAVCDYGDGTHTYEYAAAIAAPANPWRSLPDLAEDNPDALPVAQ